MTRAIVRIGISLIGAEIAMGAFFGLFGVLRTDATAYAFPGNLSACQHEDGNTDGTPCVWADPDTGQLFYVDSANYR